MGNCMETCIKRQGGERKQEEEEKGSGFVNESGIERGGMRIKIVLTKEELERLLIKLKDKEGKILVDMLGELVKDRAKTVGWKPSLGTILESHEVHDMERS